MREERFFYQISDRMLFGGLVGIGFGLFLLGFLGLESANRTWLWWTLVGSLAVVFGLTVLVTIVQRRVGPIEVVVGESGVEVPRGLLGTRRLDIPYADLKGIRFIGRPRLSSRTRGKEGMFLLYGDAYTLLVSDLFEDEGEYRRCRGLLTRAALEVQPELWLEEDGKEIRPGEEIEGE